MSATPNEFLPNVGKVVRKYRRRGALELSALEKRAFPCWQELYNETQVDSMHWFNPELDDDLKEARHST
jgi:hypothetical protein